MNILDWIILAYLAIGLIRGWIRGFLSLAVSLVGFVIAYLLASHFYTPFAKVVATKFLPAIHATNIFGPASSTVQPYILDALAFLLIVIGVEAVVNLVALAISAKRIDFPVVGPLNRFLGMALGLGEHLIIASIILFVATPLLGHTHTFLGQAIANSSLYTHLMQQWAPPFSKP